MHIMQNLELYRGSRYVAKKSAPVEPHMTSPQGYIYLIGLQLPEINDSAVLSLVHTLSMAHFCPYPVQVRPRASLIGKGLIVFLFALRGSK